MTAQFAVREGQKISAYQNPKEINTGQQIKVAEAHEHCRRSKLLLMYAYHGANFSFSFLEHIAK